MAVTVVPLRLYVVAATLAYISFFCCISGKAEKDEVGAVGDDPAQIVAKALLCFSDKNIYRRCEENYRLTETGNLDVPPDHTDEYCNGACRTETNLVLDCIDNILSHFVFYNRATIRDVRDTVKAACGYGPERGNFDVSKHIGAEESSANKITNNVMLPMALMIMGNALL